MSAKVELVIREFTDDDGVTRIGITRELVRESGERVRTKGGIWTPKNDAAALAYTRDQALAYAAACDSALAAIPAKAPKAPRAHRAPTQAPPAPAPVVRNPAPARAPKAPIASLPRQAPLTGRTLTPAAPAPEGASWFADLMHQAGAV